MLEVPEKTFFRKREEVDIDIYNTDNFLNHGRRNPPESYVMYLVMKEMGWDYDTYLKQPDDLIQLIEAIVIGEKEAEIRALKKHGRR